MSAESPELGSREMAVPDDVKVVHFGSELLGKHASTAPTEASVVDYDPVHHPAYYNGHPTGIEALEVIEWNPYPNLANVIKYVWRVSWGGKENNPEDLAKARAYLDREIQRRQSALFEG